MHVDRALWVARTFGVFAIGGGAVGLIAALPAIPGAGLGGLAIGLLVCCAYAIGIWAGTRALESGMVVDPLARAYLFLQVPLVKTSIASYQFYGLLSVDLTISSPIKITFGINPGAAFDLALFHSQNVQTIGLNILPFVFLALLGVGTDDGRAPDTPQSTSHKSV